MEADTEAIGIEAQSGLLNHVVGFHTKGVVASKCMEEETNKIVNSKSMFEKEEENDENTPNLEEKGGTVDGDKEQTVGVDKPMKDEWETDEFDKPEEEDTRNDEEEPTEESDNNDGVGETEDDNNTTSTTGETDGENGKELKPVKEQKKPNQGTEKEGLATEKVANDTTDNPKIDRISLFGVGGNRNENQQEDRTNIITGSSIELTEEEEHVIASLVTKLVLNILDDKS